MKESEASFMATWEQGSPMRSFIYYLQRATCGALAYLVIHQLTLGMRLIQASPSWLDPCETVLAWASTPGRWMVGRFFDEIRPLNLPRPLAIFVLNIGFYFAAVWIVSFIANLKRRETFVGKRRDPFVLKPKAQR